MNSVALRADVSLGTVSKVLNGDPTVGTELRDRVLDACGQLNYQHNRIAASLRSRQTHTIGIIIPDILNTFYAALVEKLENLASAGGYTVMIVTTGEEAETGCCAHRGAEAAAGRRHDRHPVAQWIGKLGEDVSGRICLALSSTVFQQRTRFRVSRPTMSMRLTKAHAIFCRSATSISRWRSTRRSSGTRRSALPDSSRQCGRERHGPIVRIVGMTVEEARHFDREPVSRTRAADSFVHFKQPRDAGRRQRPAAIAASIFPATFRFSPLTISNGFGSCDLRSVPSSSRLIRSPSRRGD